MTKEKKEKEKIIDEIDNKIYELPDLPKLELGDGLLNTLGVEAEDILDDQFVNPKQLEEKTIEQIKEEYNFDEIKDAFDRAAVPAQLGFFYGGDNENFVRACNFLKSMLKSMLEIENAFDLLRIFQMFYHFNSRSPLTNGLLVVPDGETPEGSEKIYLKYLYEMFQGTKSHGLVSLEFLCTLGIFWSKYFSIKKCPHWSLL